MRLVITAGLAASLIACATTPAEEAKDALNRAAIGLSEECAAGNNGSCVQLCEEGAMLGTRAWIESDACMVACRSGRAQSCLRLCHTGYAGNVEACGLGCGINEPQCCLSFFETQRPLPATIKADELEAAMDTGCSGGDSWACYTLAMQRVSRLGRNDPASLADVAGLFEQTCKQTPRLKDRQAQTRACTAFACLTNTRAPGGSSTTDDDPCHGRLHTFRGRVAPSPAP